MEQTMTKHNRKPSPKAINALGKNNKVEIVSKFTLDKHDCECKKEQDLAQLKMQRMSEKERRTYLDSLEPHTCPLVKKNKLKKYALSCPDCKDVVAYVHAKNKKLENKANIHYYSWYNSNSWRGTYGVNINPHTLRMTFECCCGSSWDLYQLKVNTI